MIVRASSLERISLCPGSMKATDRLFSADSADSISGRVVHEALARIWRKGTPDWQQPAKVCEEMKLGERETMIAEWFTGKLYRECEKRGGILETWAEVPLRKGEVVGTCDLIVHLVCDDWLIVDWKTGGLSVKTAADNIQLAAYACMGRERFGYSKASVYLFSAGNEAEEKFTTCTYTGAELEQVWQVISDAIAAAHADDAKLVPGLEQCRYCPALGNAERCPVAIEQALEVVEKDKLALTKFREGVINRKLTPAEREAVVALYDKISMVDNLKRNIKGFIYNRLSGGEEIEGFELGGSQERRNITDPEVAYQELVLNQKLATHDQFMAEVSITGAGVQRACRQGMGLRGVKVSEMRSYIDNVCEAAGCLEFKPTTPRLKRVKNGVAIEAGVVE